MANEYILKDKYGNERIFDKETIFVQGADGELMSFTHGTGSPNIEPLNVTENGTYTAPEGVDGYNPVTVNVDPTKITILKEQTFSGFVMDSTFGAYSPGYVSPAQFVLENEETYHVIWDGTEYECVAVSFEYYGMSMVVIGNGSTLGLPSNQEPFLITYNATSNNTQLFSTETKDSHTVGIWKSAIQKIKLQDKTITENGTYTADSGFDGLAQVIVAVAGNAGSSNVKIVTGTVDAEYSSSFDLNHGLGVIPDYIYIMNPSEKNGYISYGYGFSQKLKEKTPPDSAKNTKIYKYNSQYYISSTYAAIDSENANGAFFNATETSVRVACLSNSKCAQGSRWFAVGGLV